MYNFFDPIRAVEGNIYFLSWLFNSSKSQNIECFEKATLFIYDCYSANGIQAPQNIDKLEVLYIDQVSIYCMVNDNDLIIIKTEISYSLYKLISTNQSDVGFLHINEINKKYNANQYLFIFLETKYIGNRLQIEKETMYSVLFLEKYINFLSLNQNLCNKQILDEIILYEKNILDNYNAFLNIKYENWGIEQYKGFFRSLQNNLKNGEGKNNNEFGELWYFDLFEYKKGNIKLNFRLKHNNNTIDIRAGFNDTSEKKTQRPLLIKEIENILSAKNIQFKKQSRPGRSFYTTLGTIIDPVIKLDSKGLVDINETIRQLTYLNKILSI